MKRIIVNRNDEIIGAKSNAEIVSSDIYRVSQVWVVADGKVLIQQRKFDKRNDPGKWGPSVAGRVEEGETYLTNAQKELGEEVGIFDTVEPMHEESKFHDGQHKYFVKKFIVRGEWTLDDFTPQESEVEALKLVEINDLLSDIDAWPTKYLDNFRENVLGLMDYLNNDEAKNDQ